jgi:hypothetical protein
VRDLGVASDESDNGDNGLSNSRRLQLDSPPRVRRYLTRLIARWDHGDLPSEDLGRLAVTLKVLMGMVTGDSTERRLQALEARLEELRQP